jgi:hypothetical protein
MVIASILMLAQTETTVRVPGYFPVAIMGLFLLGTVVSVVAAVLGFARARAFGPSARWFSFASVCLILFHIQFLVLGFGFISDDIGLVFGILTFFNAFILLAGICMVLGFVRLTSPR